MNDKLKSRIAALMAKTVENGCSEEEAASAATLLANMLDMHGVTIADVTAMLTSKETVDVTKMNWTSGKKLHEAYLVAQPIAAFFGCKVWRSLHGGDLPAIVFFGLSQDAYAACTLLETVKVSMDTEWQRYLKTVPWDRRGSGKTVRMRTSFMNGMILRLTSRLSAMLDERNKANAPPPGGGTALVVLKNQLVEREFKSLEMKLTASRSTRARSSSNDAHQAGMAAGDRTSLSAGKGVTETKRIAG